MKVFIKILTVFLVSTFCCTIDSADREAAFLFTPEGKMALGISQNLINREGFIKLLQDANVIADTLLKFVSDKSVEEEKPEFESDIIFEPKNIEFVEEKPLASLPEKPFEKLNVESVSESSDNQQLNIESKQSIIEQFKLSTQDTYISNLQTLILDNNIQLGSDIFIAAEVIALDFLKTIIKDNTKWVGIFSYSLALNSYSAYSGVSLERIKEMIIATIIVFEDPLCEFESNGSFYNNKTEYMRLSRFLLQCLSVPRATILFIIDQAVSLPRITNLQQMARSIHE